ncbi:MAG: class II fructose-bisphosphate aldolase [Candidatus Berkelbacteria bacterium]|nr:class II fructose-bisphosphate aldolase [Candidatus Berkelbacteria bacterium]
MINVAHELKKARANGYAIGAFNTANLEVTKAICSAASKADFPILIQTTPGAIEYAGLKQLFDIITDEIKSSGAKAGIHLDHAHDFLTVKQAIDIGYSSVMFDGSKYPYEENILMTEKVVDYAHKFGVSVEAEVGIIGREEGGRLSGKAVYSGPPEVVKFVEETGVDSIAISVGNEHGAPEGEKLDLSLLERISNVVEIPLVMHGASGLSHGDIRHAMGIGVAKFNIDTNIRKAFTSALESSDETDYRVAMEDAMAHVEKVVLQYIKLFRGA